MKKTTIVLLLSLIGMVSNAQYTKLSDFGGANVLTGTSPEYDQNLISDGTFLYGMTRSGGINNQGVIYKMLPDGTGYVKLLDFVGTTNGSQPYGSLLYDGTFLYGMTRSGGINDYGTIFKIMPDGSGFVKLLDFAGVSNGRFPLGSLVFDGTVLYGMTREGGANGIGTIFKILPDGSGFVKLLDFSSTVNGANPNGSLTIVGSELVGMTSFGGINNSGVVFKLNSDGTGFQKILDFAGTSNGQTPYGSLLYDGTFLFGMTRNGGASHAGNIFKIKPDGTGFLNMYSFDAGSNGWSPYGSLVSDGTKIYGMTMIGGANNSGVLFTIKKDGTLYNKLHDFDGSPNGGNPFGSLLFDGTFLRGVVQYGGNYNAGLVFKIKFDGTQYTKLFHFSIATNGNSPAESLLAIGNVLYGMTSAGGIFNKGTIFKINSDGTSFTKMFDFDGSINGQTPAGSFSFDGTYLYGTTAQGGTNNMGTIFKIKPDGTGYLKLLDFDGVNKGNLPRGNFVTDNVFLYGITNSGGLNGNGVVYKIMPDGTGFAKLLDLSSISSGSGPNGGLFFDGTFIYGTTGYGGTNNMGVLFKIKPDGTSFSKLIDFVGASNGNYPNGTLIMDGSYLYGTLFRIMPDGTGFTKLRDYAYSERNPTKSLVSEGGFLYGSTQSGGTTNQGTMYKIKPDGTNYTTLINYTGINGHTPVSSMISEGNFLYGMTNGGIHNFGTVFKFQHCFPTSSTAIHTSCNSYTWIDGLTYTSSNNTATWTLTNAAGCDSLITLDLTINNSNSGTDIITACDSHTWIDGYTYTSSNNTATWTVTNAAGCDSLVTLDLTINNSNSGTDIITACDSHTWIDGYTYTSSNTSATWIVQNAIGCDSIITLDLTMNYSSTSTLTEYAIDSYTSPSGMNYTSSGTYTDVISNMAGCDSTITIHLTMGYTGITQNALDYFQIYPNPNDGSFIVSSFEKGSFQIMNEIGQVVNNIELNNENNFTVQIENIQPGMYFIVGNTSDRIVSHKVIVN